MSPRKNQKPKADGANPEDRDTLYGRFVAECLAFAVFAVILTQADKLDARRIIRWMQRT
ncbi:MAG: hypothetical protein WBA42_08080 [Mesorhizobium sp.]